jgi:hypothetical protein
MGDCNHDYGAILDGIDELERKSIEKGAPQSPAYR